jgi:uncharacterized membrane protein
MVADSPKTPERSMTAPGAETIVFRARLTPHRSLGRMGYMILFGFIFGVTVLVSIPFYILGALPIVGFFGLDALLLWIAFRVSNARARAYEEIVLTHIELLFRRMSWRGRLSEWRFNPLWVKLSRHDHAEFGTQRIALVEGGRHVEMGAFLGAEEKADFAGALKLALAEARRGPRY